jgi:aspartate aminotransferase
MPLSQDLGDATQPTLRLSKRMSQLGTEGAFEILSRARALELQGKEIIHLEIGEPDFETPANVVQAAIDALHKGCTHYGPSAGLPELRQTIAEYVSRSHGVEIDSDEVVIVPGGKPTIFFTILALVDPGDEVIYLNPGFPIYESMISYVGGRPVPIHLSEARNFGLDVKELESLITDNTKLIILNSPHNPTGSAMSREEVMETAEAIGDREIMVLSDEIYSRLLFEGEHHSIFSVPGFKDRTILADSFSKTFAMTGWRLGYGVMRSELAAQVTRLMINSNSCTATFTQLAGIEAIHGSQSSVDRMRNEFRRRRDFFVAGLNQIRGFSCRVPKGTFYVFPNITQTGWGSKALADALLQDAGIACLSGTEFGNSGEGFLRFSVANSLENLERALCRIDAWSTKNV